MQPKVIIRYAPHPVNVGWLRCPVAVSALFYLEDHANVFGWYAQARRTRHCAAFFMIENFYAQHQTVLYRSLADDVYDAWQREAPPPVQPVRCPVPEEMRHELERLQSAFIDEWLFYGAEPEYQAELEAYQRRKLGLCAFNVRSKRLAQLNQDEHVWRYNTASSNMAVADFLQSCWSFDARSGFVLPNAYPSEPFRRYDEVDISSTKKGRT